MLYNDRQKSLYQILLSSDQPLHLLLSGQLSSLRREQNFYSDLLFILGNFYMDNEEAREHIEAVLAYRSKLEEDWGQAVDFRVAFMDYFMRSEIRFKSPKIIELETYEKGLKDAATDQLTGLLNRRSLEQFLDREVNRSSRHQQIFSVLFVDLDKFKLVNDTHGHSVGDEVLRKFAWSVKQVVRNEDATGRYGGEEFVLVLPHTSAEGMIILAQRLKRFVSEQLFPKGLELTFSAGGATFPEDGETKEEMLEVADRALYRAKAQGRDRICTSQYCVEDKSELHIDVQPKLG